jgi:transposase InsO family protein
VEGCVRSLAQAQQCIALVQNHCKAVTKKIHTDNGAEFTSQAFQQLLADYSILANKIPPDAHSQNGRVEQAHLTILRAVRTLLTNTSLPLTFWAEAASYSAHMRNRVPDAREGRIEYTVWSGCEVNHQHIRPFGCDIYVQDHTQTKKLEPQFKKDILIGWAEDSEHTVKY